MMGFIRGRKKNGTKAEAHEAEDQAFDQDVDAGIDHDAGNGQADNEEYWDEASTDAYAQDSSPEDDDAVAYSDGGTGHAEEDYAHEGYAAGSDDEAPEEHAQDYGDDAAEAAPKGLLARLKSRIPGERDASTKASRGQAKEASGITALLGRMRGAGKGIGADAPVGIQGELSIEGGVITIGKLKTAAGLFWDQRDEDVSVRAKVEALNETAKLEEPDEVYSLWADLRRSNQMAFTRTSAGHKAGMPALATMISPAVAGENWLGAFHVDPASDIWWLAAGRGGEIFEDQIIRGRMGAEDEFRKALDAPDLNSIFAPEDWGYDGTRPETLQEVVAPSLAEKLRHVRPIKAHLPRIILGSVVLVGAAAGFLYIKHQKTLEMLAIQEAQRRMREQIMLNPQDQPWANVVRIKTFLTACEQQIARSARIVPGWNTQPISCMVEMGQGTVTAGWSRDEGAFSWLRSAIPPEMPAPTLSENGQQAEQVVTFEVPFDEASHEDQPWEGAQIAAWLHERFQNFDISAEIVPSQSNLAEAVGAPVYNSTDIRLSSPFGMSIYGDFLEDVPALVPMTMIYNLETNIWDLVLRVHHPVMLPTVSLPGSTQ